MKTCPEKLPEGVTETIRSLAEEWLASDDRPVVNQDILSHWDKLIEEWVKDKNMPLIVRSPKFVTGSLRLHENGRKLIPADNSPAAWVMTVAERGELLSLRDIEELIRKDEIPFSFAVSAKDKPSTTYFCNLAKIRDNPNARGWKVAHIEGIGMNRRDEIEQIPIKILEDHFRKFMNPRNMFMIPKQLAGLAEVEAFYNSFKQG